MESSVFTDKSTLPDNENLSQLLREAWKFWEAIKNHINELKNTHKYAEGRGIRIEVKS